jgi:hypothetical protein
MRGDSGFPLHMLETATYRSEDDVVRRGEGANDFAHLRLELLGQRRGLRVPGLQDDVAADALPGAPQHGRVDGGAYSGGGRVCVHRRNEGHGDVGGRLLAWVLLPVHTRMKHHACVFNGGAGICAHGARGLVWIILVCVCGGGGRHASRSRHRTP